MCTSKRIAAATLLGLLATVPAYAGHQHDCFEHRERRQAERIEQGVRSGALTRGEAQALRDHRQGVARLERRLRRAGRLSKGDRRKLQATLDRLSRRIHVLKHNDRYRGAGRQRQQPAWCQLDGRDRWARYDSVSDAPPWY